MQYFVKKKLLYVDKSSVVVKRQIRQIYCLLLKKKEKYTKSGLYTF